MYFFARPLLCITQPYVCRDIMKPIDSLTDDEFIELVQCAARLPDAPPTLLEAAIDLWPKAELTTPSSLAETVGQIVQAVLSFDSWARPSLASGMRSTGSDTRHLLFSALAHDVDLRIDGDAGAFTMTGQILGPDEAGTIELAADPHSLGSEVESAGSHTGDHGDGEKLISSRVTTLNELGEFRLDDIHAGTYRLTLRMGSDEVVLPPIVVGEKPS